MNKYFTLILLLFIFTSGICRAQTSLTDTIFQLSTVEVKSERQQDNNLGGRSSYLSSAILESGLTQSIGTLLSDNSLIYIKSMGQGGLSTSSFRGTSSNHTQVNWNGININPIMGGSFDFSQFPSFFTDEVTLFHGNNYLKNGTGALGGSINLNNNINWQNTGIKSKVLGELGANQTYTGGLITSYTTDKWHTNTRLYYQESENDFKYLNKILTNIPFHEKRKNSQYKQWGIMQELVYKLPTNDQLSANVWYMDNKNHLPQPIVVDHKQNELQKARNLRSVLKFDGSTSKSNYTFSAAYLLNDFHYSKWDDIYYYRDESKNKSHSIIGKADYTYYLNEKITLGTNFNYRYDLVKTNKYKRNTNADSLEEKSKSRNTFTWQGNLIWKPTKPLSINLQIMAEYNNNKFMPTFSAGADYTLIQNRLNLKASAAYNYHYPTLNDLYWEPGGNPSLHPEKGFAYDATLNFRTDIDKNIYFKADISYYLMTINDWIIWTRQENSSMWSPQNLQKVLSHGAEIMTETSLRTGILWHRLNLNYAYSPSVNKTKKTDKDASKNKQLPYIPLHKWNARYMLNIKQLSFSYGMAYTSSRYTTVDESLKTEDFLIHDASIGYTFRWKERYSVQLKLRVDNIYNTYYESTEYYPMPLRSWYVSLQFNL